MNIFVKYFYYSVWKRGNGKLGLPLFLYPRPSPALTLTLAALSLARAMQAHRTNQRPYIYTD
jgi:hypothetical protein